MGELLTESQVRQLRLVGPQSAAEIIRAMESLGWKPQLSSLDVSFALGSAVHGLTVIAAKARRLGEAHPQAADDLIALAEQARRQAAKLKAVRGRLKVNWVTTRF